MKKWVAKIKYDDLDIEDHFLLVRAKNEKLLKEYLRSFYDSSVARIDYMEIKKKMFLHKKSIDITYLGFDIEQYEELRSKTNEKDR